jgi:Macro domain
MRSGDGALSPLPESGNGRMSRIEEAAARWPTPDTNPERPNLGSNKVNGSKSIMEAALQIASTWPTPISRDHRSIEAGSHTHAKNSRPLSEFVGLWATPRSSDAEKGGPNQQFGADGIPLPARVQTVIWLQKFQELLVGSAVVVPTYHESIPFLIVAPTMRVPKIITGPADVMLATRAAVRCAAWDFQFNHIAMPGMGTGCGQVRPDTAVRAMRAGIKAGLRDTPRRPLNWREAQEWHFQLRG